MAQKPLPGSERHPMRGARAVGRTAGDQRLEATVVVRRRDPEGLRAHVADLAQGRPRAPMTHDAFAAAYGAAPEDLERVAAFAQTHGLAVVQTHAARRSVVLSGSVAQFEAAFGVELSDFEFDGGSYRGRTGALHVPEDLNKVIEAVLGLDNRPAAKPHFRIRQDAAAAPTAFTPIEVAELYGFPAGDGVGQTVALIELGGGYKPADLQTYFKGLGVTAPKVTALSVDHAKNAPTGSADGPDGEVMLDIEVVGAVAPGAAIGVYFAPNTDAGFLDAITTAAHDQANKPSVISISWGGPESSWTAQAMTSFDSAFQDAAVLGITVLVASGDNGSTDGLSDGAQHVDFPASSPHATGCGGTRLTAKGAVLEAEQVWNDGADGGAGGGGVSATFALPTWQAGLAATAADGAATPLARRGVPDVAGDADPDSGYEVRVDGQDTVIGGTSAVAPLWAGLIARINAASGARAGFINPALYKSPQALHDITVGDNGAFEAAKGWDACTGLGTPNGAAVAAALKA
ncbi:S53 family peptidase [Phenylobacterium sp.]|uniref:S53 family peptidase n=1 Tax=Phenylobacterium sp. TaxID=1871053 RepID=UPI00121365B2|nr:S53 family peptidase [Phenylobacterium sp.]THD58058.1 MAG: peptidase S53 [Phenylobacterium sp.]